MIIVYSYTIDYTEHEPQVQKQTLWHNLLYMYLIRHDDTTSKVFYSPDHVKSDSPDEFNSLPTTHHRRIVDGSTMYSMGTSIKY
jgi:hypothetical protein